MSTQIREMQLELRDQARHNDSDSATIWSGRFFDSTPGYVDTRGVFYSQRTFAEARGRALAELGNGTPKRRRIRIEQLRSYNRYYSYVKGYLP